MWFRWYKGTMKVSYLNLETIVNFNYVTSMFPSYFILNLYVLVHSARMMVIIIGPRAILSVIVLFSKCSILIRIGNFDAGPIFNLAPERLSPQMLCFQIPLMARYTRCNFMWSSLSVTGGRSVVFSRYSGFLYN
jgi:hypothetical protein